MTNIVQILLPFLFYIVSTCYGQSAGYQCPQNGYSWRADPKNCSVAHLCVFGKLIQSLTCPKDLVIGVDNYSCVQKGSYFDNCGQRVELFIVSEYYFLLTICLSRSRFISVYKEIQKKIYIGLYRNTETFWSFEKLHLGIMPAIQKITIRRRIWK